jgi:hypothetical protein
MRRLLTAIAAAALATAHLALYRRAKRRLGFK